MRGKPDEFACPSAQPDMVGARVFGVVSGDADGVRVAYLKADAKVSLADISALGDVEATRVFRFAGQCEEHRCAQFENGRCGLGDRITAMLTPVVECAPSCQIRDICRWHSEQGIAACLRCPQIVTRVPSDDSALARAADPSVAQR